MENMHKPDPTDPNHSQHHDEPTNPYHEAASLMNASGLGSPQLIPAHVAFPLDNIDLEELRDLYAMQPAELDIVYTSPVIRGNYVATLVQADLRRWYYLKATRNINLEAVLYLPIELFLEVFSYLHPLDLYNMIRTTKPLRNILLNKQAAALVWENVFQSHPDIPPCPTDVSPPKWASLLFGPATCDFCPHKNAMPDFTYRQRLCEGCIRRTCRTREQIRADVDLLQSFPEEEETLFKLTKYTYKAAAMRYPDKYAYLEEPRYRFKDVQSKAEEMVQYLEVIAKGGVEGARGNYTAFAAESRSENLVFLKHAKVCNEWCRDSLDLLHGIYIKKVLSCTWLAYTILQKRGHEICDIDLNETYTYLLNYFRSVKHIRFSKKELEKHLPALEEIVKSAREIRLKQERLELKLSLQKKVSSFYKSSVQTGVAPELWDYIPDAESILKLSEVLSYTDAEYETTDDAPDLSAVDMGPVLLDFVSEWIAKTKRYLLRIFATSVTSPSAFASDAEFFALDLATAVFKHPSPGVDAKCKAQNSVLFAWEEAAVHASCSDLLLPNHPRSAGTENDFELCTTAYDTVFYLLRLLGMNPVTTFASHLDGLNKRFICMRCPLASENGINGSYAMDWRECASHSVISDNAAHETPLFALLTEEATESILFHETGRYASLAEASRWSCKHCREHFEPVSKKEAVKHVLEKHQIHDAVEDVDYFCRRDKTSHTRQLYFWARDDNFSQRCLLCQGHSRARLWSHDALVAHLSKQHKIKAPVESIHWKSPRLVERATD